MGYVDPGMFGLVSQIGFALLFAVTSVVAFLFKPLRQKAAQLLKRQGPTGNQDTNDTRGY